MSAHTTVQKQVLRSNMHMISGNMQHSAGGRMLCGLTSPSALAPACPQLRIPLLLPIFPLSLLAYMWHLTLSPLLLSHIIALEAAANVAQPASTRRHEKSMCPFML